MADLHPGQTIEAKGPTGNFLYSRNMVKKLGMIAGGVGITPMLQIIGAIIRDPEDMTEIYLIFANSKYDDIILKDEIDEIAEKYPNFNVHYVLEKPPKSNWQGSIGYVTPEIISQYLPSPQEKSYKILLSGPPPMMNSMRQAVAIVGHQKPPMVSMLEDQVYLF